jgi:hypothetical protein
MALRISGRDTASCHCFTQFDPQPSQSDILPCGELMLVGMPMRNKSTRPRRFGLAFVSASGLVFQAEGNLYQLACRHDFKSAAKS